MSQSILEMAKDLVMAQIQTGGLSPEEMQKELQRTYANLADLKAKEDLGESSVELGGETDLDGDGTQANVSWKKSIKKYTIECLICGAAFKQLSVRHLKEHGMDARAYRVRFGIPRTQPLSAKDTTATRKKIVQESRPWEKAPTYIKAQDRKAEAIELAKAPGRSKRQAATSEA